MMLIKIIILDSVSLNESIEHLGSSMIYCAMSLILSKRLMLYIYRNPSTIYVYNFEVKKLSLVFTDWIILIIEIVKL